MPAASATEAIQTPDASTQNLNVVGTRSLITPRELEAEHPLTEAARQTVVEARAGVRHVLAGSDPRLLAVVGPCSIHDVDAARDYGQRLAAVARDVSDRILVVMRVYFEKPRTTTGWKGLINDPHLDGTFDMNRGLRLARLLLLDLAEMGLPTGTEFLDPFTPQYIDDLVSWAAIGARTTESQTHRQMASGLSMPVGFKNGTDGNLQVALDAMNAARNPHAFLGIDEEGKCCVFQTRGNDAGHVILRGGGGRTNFEPEDVTDAAARLAEADLPPRLMVDCSHANSGKKHDNQPAVWRNLLDQRANAAATSPIIGIMLESNLFEGRQPLPDQLGDLRYGVSITDACLGWDDTEALLRETHQRLE
ncbi:MAG: 3-deoxy-7-phosphoheptulonate synthase [Phycisphaeraceae bacterium]